MRWTLLFFPIWLALWLVYLVLAAYEGLMDGFPAILFQPIMGALIAGFLAGGLVLLILFARFVAVAFRRWSAGQ
jgi:hypothetical protein